MRYGWLAAAATALVCAGQASAARYVVFQISGATTLTTYDVNTSPQIEHRNVVYDVTTAYFDTSVNNTTHINGLANGIATNFSVYYSGSSIQTLNQPGGPIFSLAFDPARISQGSILAPLSVTGGYGFYNCYRSTCTAVSGDLFSVSAYTTDVAPASLVSTEVAVTAPVPEPGIWAMMIIGMGAVGFTMRRRQSIRVSYAA